ncbi:MAG: KTSC domain-containing protein [Rhodobacteraceae bacterium]|nr:KTSC domain-containing protein [Paracoccaceae bacterium]
MNGSEYHYSNVPKELFDQVHKCTSVGRTFNTLIKYKLAYCPHRQVA